MPTERDAAIRDSDERVKSTDYEAAEPDRSEVLFVNGVLLKNLVGKITV